MRAGLLLGGSLRTALAAGAVASLGLLRDMLLAARFGATTATDAWGIVVGLALAIGFTLASATSLVLAPRLAAHPGMGARAAFGVLPRGLLGGAILAGLLLALLGLLAPGALLRRPLEAGELATLRALLLVSAPIPLALLVGQLWAMLGRYRGHHGRASLLAGWRAGGAVVVLLLLPGSSLAIAAVAGGLLVGLGVEAAMASRLAGRGDDAGPGLPPPVAPALGWPLAVTLVPALSFLTDKLVVSAGDAGGVAQLEFAYKLVALPHGLLALSLVQVAHVEITRGLGAGDPAAARRDALRSFGLLAVGMAVVAVGLLLLSPWLVALVYGRGAMDAGSLQAVAAALQMYAPGLVGMGLGALAARLCFALEAARWAGVGAMLLLLLNLLADLWAFPRHGVEGVAAVTSALSFVWALWLFGANRVRALVLGGGAA